MADTLSEPAFSRILKTFRLFPTAAGAPHAFLFPITVPINGTKTAKFLLEVGYEVPSGAPKATYYFNAAATDRDLRLYHADNTYAQWHSLTLSDIEV